jgi:prepilin signal peptidase PulO-like enzyme (type II secretory pathway)
MIIISLALLIAGLCLGSFVNALVWRVHEQSRSSKAKSRKASHELSILTGRSLCPNCRHQLSTADLIPVLSWLYLRGRCRYCHKPIEDSPLIELGLAAVFLASYIFWPVDFNVAGQWVLFITWLASAVGLMALFVYDARWSILPNRIIYPTAVVATIGRLVYLVGFEDRKLHALLAWALSVAIASGIFYLLFIGSKGKWIGFGDVRLGLITGTLLADPVKSFLMIFLASALGTLVALPGIIGQKKSLQTRIPYGPFLIAACFITILFGGNLIDWYQTIFGL